MTWPDMTNMEIQLMNTGILSRRQRVHHLRHINRIAARRANSGQRITGQIERRITGARHWKNM